MRSHPRRSRLAVELHGCGRVGRALLALLPTAGVRLACAQDRTGVRFRGATGEGRRVLVDATSPQYDGSEAEGWIRRLEKTLGEGTPVVTCNKAPLAVAWGRLERAARSGRTTISCAGTVGGGTPVLLLLQRLHQSQGIQRIEATLNATLGYVCSQVAAGAPLATAVQRAQEEGWAEPDPSFDLDGTDVYSKAVIIHNLLFASGRPLVLDRSRPRLHLEEERIVQLARSGKSSHVLSTVVPGRVGVDVVGLPAWELVPDAAGLVQVRATLRDGSEVSLTGPGAGPRVTAGALLGDLRALAEGGESGPWGVVP